MTLLTTDAAERKAAPVFRGFMNYFPRAMVEVAKLSMAGNEQHNPGKELFWDRSKSGDELDACSRHMLEAGTIDTDGQRHSAKVAWRAMANLEKELEAAEETLTEEQSAPLDVEADLAKLTSLAPATDSKSSLAWSIGGRTYEAAHGWRRHLTDECPVGGELLVCIVFSEGDFSDPHPAKSWDWRQGKGNDTPYLYRVVDV